MLLNQKPTKIVDTGFSSFKKNIFKTRNKPNQFKPTLAKDLANSTAAVKKNITGITKDYHMLDRLKRPTQSYTAENNIGNYNNYIIESPNFYIDLNIIFEAAKTFSRFPSIAASLARKAKSISPSRPFPKPRVPVYAKKDKGNEIPVRPNTW